MNSSYLFYGQMIFFLALFYFGSLELVIRNPILAIILTFGIILALWSFYNMGSESFSPFPEPKKNNKFVESGPYKYIRHPMYTGMILIALTLFISNMSIVSFTVLAIFLYIIDEKATVEEKFLTDLHSQYKTYQEITKKFIPFVY